MLHHWLSELTVISTKMSNLSSREALAIGKAFSTALEDRAVVEAGVEMWIQQYPALIELSKSNKFFTSMAITIGKHNLAKAPWGLAAKVAIGACLSFFSIVTDMLTIFTFRARGKYDFANATIAMIAGNMALQMFAVFSQRRKRGFRVLATEVLIVISYLKPAIVLHRIMQGAKGKLYEKKELFMTAYSQYASLNTFANGKILELDFSLVCLRQPTTETWSIPTSNFLLLGKLKPLSKRFQLRFSKPTHFF